MVRIFLLLTLAGGVVALLPTPGLGQDPPQYQVTNLPVPSEFVTSLVRGLTGNGLVYGFCRRANGEQSAAYWTPEGRFQLVPVDAGVKFSRLLGANEWGDLVGDQWSEPTGNHRATLWVSGRPHMLGKPGEHSVAYAINRSGTMVGAHGPNPNSLTACEFRADGTVIDIATFPSSAFSQATQINERGDIAGDWFDRTARAYRPFLRTAEGQVRNLGVLPGFTHSLAQDINSSGDVVGMSVANLTGTGPARAFYYSARRNRLFYLPTPANYYSMALGVNDAGDVAGVVFPQEGTPPRGTPTLWRRTSPTGGPRIAQVGDVLEWVADYINRVGEVVDQNNNGVAAGNGGSGTVFQPFLAAPQETFIEQDPSGSTVGTLCLRGDEYGRTTIINGTGRTDRGFDTVTVTSIIKVGETEVATDQGTFYNVTLVKWEGGGGDDKLVVNNLNIPLEADGGDGDDTIQGGNGSNKISGGAGNDEIKGGNGRNDISGGDGNDTIQGGNGRNKLDGGAGNDTIQGGDALNEISGGAGDDKIKGGNLFNDISGGDGNDEIDGGPLRDVISGGPGSDTLRGGRGDDLLIGGSAGSSSSDSTAQSAIARKWLLLDSEAVFYYEDQIADLRELPFFDDGALDELRGEGGRDGFVARGDQDSLPDLELTNQGKEEVISVDD
jgi:Ca2+-binding RTX toxin-like protein